MLNSPRSQISFILSATLLGLTSVHAAPNVKPACASAKIALAVDALLIPLWRQEAYQFCSTYISIPVVTETVTTKLVTTTATTVFPTITVKTETLPTTVTTKTLTITESTETPLATQIVTETETTLTPLATFSTDETTATVTPLVTTSVSDTTATVTPIVTVSITTATSTVTPLSTKTITTSINSPVPVKVKRDGHLDERGIVIPSQFKTFVGSVLSQACSCISTGIPLKTTYLTATSTVKRTATSYESKTATVYSPETASATTLVTATAATLTELETTFVTATAPNSTITIVQYNIATAPTETITDTEYEIATAPTHTITNIQYTVATAPVSVITSYSTVIVPVCQSTPLPNWTFQNYNCEAWTVSASPGISAFCGLSGTSIYQLYLSVGSSTVPVTGSMKQTISVCPGYKYTFSIQYYMDFSSTGASGDVYVGGVHILHLPNPGNFGTLSATFTPTVSNPILEIDISCTSNCQQLQFNFESISVTQSFS
ncbi:hypothetical protein TWF694_010066 [Orbilia ellipsospora]|uniref:Uncharacterized protein n=1 Tax=Orbilia ellipsospora TaxID=2528407 RepID=A0AAV9X988_9PEZI